MKVLYVASDQVVPGTTGGSVHVLEVARGLARRGHEVDVIVRRDAAAAALPDADGVRWHRISWWPAHRFFRFRARRASPSRTATRKHTQQSPQGCPQSLPHPL